MENVGDQATDAPPHGQCTPGWCGMGHGAKCFNAGRCLRLTKRRTTLFDKADLPRTPRVKRMRVADAGNGPGCKVIQFVCPHCGYDTGWIKDERTVTENRRGLPCPKCNGGADVPQI